MSQITRHVCVEGWSAIGSWQGARLSDFLQRIGADTRAKYVWFKCAEGYTNTIDMPTALHPQTQMTFKFDHKILPRAYGFPMKIRIPTKLGFKNPKYVVAMEVTNTDHGGYWENQGYNWFSGLYRYFFISLASTNGVAVARPSRRSAARHRHPWRRPSAPAGRNS